MIKVKGKTLEVGDVAIFKNGGVAIVKALERADARDELRVWFKGSDRCEWYVNDGTWAGCSDHMLNIVDIKKRTNPDVVEYYLHFANRLGNIDIVGHTHSEDILSYICEPSNCAYGSIKVLIDKTNQCLISSEVVIP